MVGHLGVFGRLVWNFNLGVPDPILGPTDPHKHIDEV